MVASATKATATVVAWVGDLVQECDNHIGKVHTWHSYHCSWFSLSISLRSWQVMNKNSREIFETIKCSLFIHPLPFYTCEVAPRGGGIVRTDMTFWLRGMAVVGTANMLETFCIIGAWVRDHIMREP
jgi:hypothetical protein